MNAADAISELRELSTQIETVIIASREGEVVASSLPHERAGEVASAARELAAGADRIRQDLGREALAQLQAATPQGSVFVVLDGNRMAIATTGSDPTVGLVFYDLKTLLRQTANGEEDDGAA